MKDREKCVGFFQYIPLTDLTQAISFTNTVIFAFANNVRLFSVFLACCVFYKGKGLRVRRGKTDQNWRSVFWRSVVGKDTGYSTYCIQRAYPLSPPPPPPRILWCVNPKDKLMSLSILKWFTPYISKFASIHSLNSKSIRVWSYHPPPPPKSYFMYSILFRNGMESLMVRGRIQRKTWCMGPYAGVDYSITSPYVHSRVDSKTFTMGNPLSTLTLCQNRL